MSDHYPFDFDEPPVNPLDDTHPTTTFRAVNANDERHQHVPIWRRVMGLVSLMFAAGLTLATAYLLFAPDNPNPAPTPPAFTEEPILLPATPTLLPSDTPEDAEEAIDLNNPPQVDVLPTISPDIVNALLSEPPQMITIGQETSAQVVRDLYNPFTIIPDRPRSEVIEYEIVSGDTIYTLAERYAIAPESIAWCNDRQLIQALRPGRTLIIPPIDGACATAIGSRTIADIAGEYFVDPYAVIDSEYNDLFGATPDTVPPSGTLLFLPGGSAEQISWNPPVVRTGGSGDGGGSGSASGGTIAFAPGDPGSCGPQPNPGGTFWRAPLSNYTFIRGFDGVHSGVDLSAPTGTTVYAANGGTVIFSGWSTWGYGYTVVLAHGPYTTLYGHLSAISVGCGRTMAVGDPVGAVGTSGNSTGPHLHFEIRYLDTPTNPTATIGF